MDKTTILSSNILKSECKISGKIDVTFEEEGEQFKTYFNITKYKNIGNIFYLYEEIPNRCIYYILPMLFDNKIIKSIYSFKLDLLINAYCNNDVIVIKYRYLPFEKYDILSKNLTNHPLFIKKESTNNNRFDLYFFQIPAWYKQDIQKFLNSDFNKFTETYIKNIIKFNNLKPTDKIYQVITDDIDLRKSMEASFDVKIPKNIALENKLKKEEIWNEENKFK